MAAPKITTDIGKSTLMKMGHTTNGNFGDDPNAKVKGSRPVRDLSLPVVKR